MDPHPTLPLTQPDGTPLPPPPREHWRQHTGTTLARHHPEAHAQALDLIRHGESISEVARLIGPELNKTDPGSQDGLRKIIRGWIIEARIDLTDIARLKAAIVRDEALEAAASLLPHAKVRDLGPVAMTLTQANQVERNLGGLATDFEPAWLVSARAMRHRPLCFQVWVENYAACFDKVPPQCLYWFEPETDHTALPLHKVQMWECLSGSIEVWRKDQLSDVPVLVNMGKEHPPMTGHYWFTIDYLPEGQPSGHLDVGDTELLEEHKEANVIKLQNGQLAIYPNNRLKWLPVSLTGKDAPTAIPAWEVATNAQWDEWWADSEEILGNAKWAY